MLWATTAYCVKLSGDSLSSYSNNIEPVGLRQCLAYRIVLSDATITHFSELAPHHGGKTACIDMVLRNYVTVNLYIMSNFISSPSDRKRRKNKIKQL